MDAEQLAESIRATLKRCQGDRYAEVRAVLSMLADDLDQEIGGCRGDA